MEFRLALPADAGAISQLIIRLSGPAFANPDGTGTEKFLESVSEGAVVGHMADDRYRHLAAVEAGQLAGIVTMRDRSHLLHLFVEERFQRRGVATELWRLAMAQAVAAGHAGAFTVNSALPAEPVYRRFGFVRAGEVSQLHGIEYVPMRLDVPAHTI